MTRLVAILILFAGPLVAAPLDGPRLQALVEQALRAAGQEGHVTVSRHRVYPSCPTRPTVSPIDGGWQAVRVSCDAIGWSRTIRVEGGRPPSRKVDPSDDRGLGKVIVVKESLPRGTLITASHLEVSHRRSAHLDGLVTRKETAIGRKLKINLGAGQALLARHLQHDWQVEEGEPVTITGGSGPITIEASGVALENGQLGQAIRVTNARSGELVHVVVTGPNKVQVLPNMR